MGREGEVGKQGEGRGNAKVFGWLKEGMLWLLSLEECGGKERTSDGRGGGERR